MVGRLPRTVTEKDFFQPVDGFVGGGKIEVPVKFVRYAGPVKKPLARRAVYFTVGLPALPAGKYWAIVKFWDYSYTGDRSKIWPPLVIFDLPTTFQPLVCEFEVRADAKEKRDEAERRL